MHNPTSCFNSHPQWLGADAEKLRAAGLELNKRFGSPHATDADARARAARALNLEIDTLEDNTLQPGCLPGDDVWNFQVVEYASGVVEARAYRGVISRALIDVRSHELNDSRERFEYSIKRSRRILRARCLQLNADKLWTFTKRGKFANQDEVWATFRRFNRLMKKRFGKAWRYVAVPELHSDGETWHLHVGVKGFFFVEAVRILWQRALGGVGNERGAATLGNVHVKFFKFRRGQQRACSVAAYIAKYVGKGFSAAEKGRRLVASSEGLQPDRVRKFHMRYVSGTTKDIAWALFEHLRREGLCTEGRIYFWSRNREGDPGSDAPIWMEGFVLTAERES